MNTRLVQIAAVALLSTVTLAEDDMAWTDEELYQMKHDAMQNSLRDFDGFRGGWLGFNRGFYKQSPGSDLEKKCMNAPTRNTYMQAQGIRLGMSGMSQDLDMFTAIADMIQVIANLTECEFRKPIRDIKNFCAAADNEGDDEVSEYDFDDLDIPENPCAFSVVLENFTKNAFVLMSRGSSMAETFQAFPSENPDTLLIQTMTLGEDLGAFARVGLNFMEP